MGSFMLNAAGASNNFQAQGVNLQSQDFKSGLQNSANQYNQNFNNQSALAQQLQAQAMGAGPNPAQMALKQATDRNISQNAGMLASQRTLSPALAQRLAAQNQAQMSQQAAGQGAMMGAQQQLAAQQNLSGLYGQQQQGALGMNSTMQNAMAAYNNAQVGMQSNMNNANAGVAAQNAAGAQKAVGGLLGGAASSLFAKGGMVPENYSFGGAVDMPADILSGGLNQPLIGPYLTSQDQEKSSDDMGKGFNQLGSAATKKPIPTTVGQAQPWEMGGGMAGGAMDAGAAAAPAVADAGATGGGMAGLAAMFAAKGGSVPGVQCMDDGGAVSQIAGLIPLALAALNKGGEPQGTVPGKAEVSGDSLKNDKVPAMVSPREIIIPRSITMAANAPEKAAEFVRQEIAKHHAKHGTNFADGGGVPQALDPNQPGLPDVSSVPTGMFPDVPASPQFQSNSLFNQMRETNPGEPENFSRDSADQAVMNGLERQWRVDHGKPALGFQQAPEGFPLGFSPNGKEPMSSPEMDQGSEGPANMPQGPQMKGPAGSGGGGAGGVDSYLKPYEDIYKNAGQDQANQNYKTNQELWNLDQDRQQALESYKNDTVNPERVFQNMGTGERIKTTLGLLLGGLGSGFTGGPNVALDMLNKKIDRDIDSQKTNIGKKQSLLGVLHQQYGDTMMADGMARVMQRDYLNNEIQKQSVNSKDPMVRMRAQGMINGLALQNEQTMMQLKMYKDMKAQGGVGGIQDPVMKARTMIQMGMIPDKEQDNVYKDLEKTQNAGRMKENMMQAFDMANKENTVAGRAIHGGATPASVSAMQNLIMPILKDNEGRINEQELQRVDSLIPRPGDGAKKILEKRQAMMQFIDAKSSTPRLQAYGLQGRTPQQGQAPISSFKPLKKAN